MTSEPAPATCAPFEAIRETDPLSFAARIVVDSGEWIEILADSKPLVLLPRQAFLDAIHRMAHDMADGVVTGGHDAQ